MNEGMSSKIQIQAGLSKNIWKLMMLFSEFCKLKFFLRSHGAPFYLYSNSFHNKAQHSMIIKIIHVKLVFSFENTLSKRSNYIIYLNLLFFLNTYRLPLIHHIGQVNIPFTMKCPCWSNFYL